VRITPKKQSIKKPKPRVSSRPISKRKKQYNAEEMSALITGINTMLKVMKEFGLIDKNTKYPNVATDQLRESLCKAALRWYKAGGKRGVQVALEHVLTGKVKTAVQNGKPTFTKLDKMNWNKKRLRVTLGNVDELIDFRGFTVDPKKLLKR